MGPPTTQSHKPTPACLNQVSTCSVYQKLVPQEALQPASPARSLVPTFRHGCWAGPRYVSVVPGALPARCSLQGAPPVRFPCTSPSLAQWSTPQPPQPNRTDKNIHFFSSVPLHFGPATPLGQRLLPGDMSAGWESRHLGSSPRGLTGHVSLPSVIAVQGLQAAGTGPG